jgi:hypothetical protein
MKVVWSPIGGALPIPYRFYNVWYRFSERDGHSVWMDSTPFTSIQHAMTDKGESLCRRIAIIELPTK